MTFSGNGEQDATVRSMNWYSAFQLTRLRPHYASCPSVDLSVRSCLSCF